MNQQRRLKLRQAQLQVLQVLQQVSRQQITTIAAKNLQQRHQVVEKNKLGISCS